MVGGTSKETNWTAAFAAAERHPEGELENVHGQTLRAMEKSGSAYRRDGKWYMQGKGPGPVEEPKIEEDAPAEVTYTVRDHANWQLSMDVTGAPDTSNPEVPSAGTVRPSALGMGLFPNAQTGVWEVSTVHVVGPKVKDGKVSTKRDYTVMFTDPLGELSVAPEWVREISRDWTDKANGVGGGGPLTDRQVYDLNTRLNSNLGLKPTRKVLEDVLGTTPVQAQADGLVTEAKEEFWTQSPRERFDSMLSGLLLHEFGKGAKWAIEELRSSAASADRAHEATSQEDYKRMEQVLRVAADELAKGLRKKLVELATED